MFNSYYIGGNTTNVKAEVNLNQPSTGFIQKSNPMSRFIRFQRGSEVEELLFPIEPNVKPRLYYFDKKALPTNPDLSYWMRETKEKVYEDVTVLQVMVFGADYMLAEYVFNKDIE